MTEDSVKELQKSAQKSLLENLRSYHDDLIRLAEVTRKFIMGLHEGITKAESTINKLRTKQSEQMANLKLINAKIRAAKDLIYELKERGFDNE